MIYLIDVDQTIKEYNAAGPVTSPQFFFSKSHNFHPQGMYSEDIFGILGSPERNRSISWIDLNTHVIHPLVYDTMEKRLERKIPYLISGQKSFKLNELGYLEEDELNGKINGLSSLYKNSAKWKFRGGTDEDGDRNKIIKVLERYKTQNLFFMNKLLVIPPGFRDIQILQETGEVRVDELSNIYKKVIMLSNQIKGVSGTLYDTLSYHMQLLIRDLYEYNKTKVSKKSGLIRSLMLGKRLDFTSYVVITPDPELQIGYAGIPFRNVCGLFEPNIIFGILNSKYSNNIPPEFHLACKEYLQKEKLDI